MDNNNQDQTANSSSRARDHMANERTFLAWIRTSIGIMAFGFVVEKFSLFLKQIALFVGNEHIQVVRPHSIQSYSSIFGICLVAFGALICLLAFIKYKKVERQIENEAYQPSKLIDIMLALFVFLIGVFLVVYLNSNL